MTKRSIFGWAVFLFLIVTLAQQMPSIPGYFYFIRGERNLSQGRYQSALADYQRSVGFDPKFARAYVEMGASYRQLKKYAEAEAAFKQAMSIDNDSCASCGLGMVYSELRRYEEADKAFKKAISLGPNDVCAFEQSGRMYYEEGKYQETIAAFKQASALQPRATTYHFLGNAYAFLQRFDEALNAYRQAVQLDPDYQPAYSELGAAYYRLQRPKEAAAAFEQAIRLKRDDAKAYLGLGMAQLALGNKTGAREQYRRLQSLNPQWAAVLLIEINKGPEPRIPML
jgi:tetratricopeptide (TPR) repeat protein